MLLIDKFFLRYYLKILKLNNGIVFRNSSLLVCFSHRNLQEQTGHVPPHWAETIQISSHHPEHTFWTRGRNVLAQYCASLQWPSYVYFIILIYKNQMIMMKTLFHNTVFWVDTASYNNWLPEYNLCIVH